MLTKQSLKGMTGVYKITSPKNRVYIGSSVDLDSRYHYYKTTLAPKQPLLNRSFLKYGFSAHSFEIVCQCDMESLYERERFYGERYGAMVENGGLNIKLPGYGEKKSLTSEICREKIRKSKIGKRPSAETKAKYRAAKLGKYAGEKHPQAKLVLNKETGIFYGTIKEAALAHGIKRTTLISKFNLIGNYKRNNTSLCLV